MESVLDILALNWTHAYVRHLTVLDELAVAAILELNDLVYILRRRRCPVQRVLIVDKGIATITCTLVQLGLLSQLVTLTVIVRDLEDLAQALWRRHRDLITA